MRLSRMHTRVASRARQRGFLRLSMLMARWGSQSFRIQDLFRSSEPGVHFETYDPSTILKRTNLATNTGFSRGTTGAVPTDYIERGLVTGRKVVDATTSSGFAMRVTSTGGSTGATDDVRHAGVTGLSVGTQYTIRFKAKRAPGFTNSNLLSAFGGLSFGPQVLTDNYQTFSYAPTATGTQHSLFFGGPAGALYDVADVEVVKTTDAALPYQAVTDWYTEFLAAGGDRVTMFADVARTTPIWAVEQTIASFRDTSRVGSTVYATQATAGFRPKLEARVNLLLKSQEFDDAAWLKTDITVTANAVAAPDGTQTADLLTTGVAGTENCGQSITAVAAGYRVRRCLKRGNHDWVRVQASSADGSTTGFRAWVNLTSGAVGTKAGIGTGTFVSCTTKNLGGGWWEVVMDGSVTAGTLYSYTMSCTGDNATARVANGTRYEWGADLRTAADAALDIPAYQRVNTASDYDTEGFPHRVRHDGTDDYLSVPLNMSTTDKLTAWISGNLKTSDAATAALAELTASSTTTNQSFAMLAPPGATSPTYFARSKGTADAIATTAGTFAAPRNDVFCMAADVAGDSLALDVNGAQAATSASDQGAGNYANDTLYIGRRGGASLPSTVGWCALTVRGATTDAGSKTRTTRYHARLSKINL